ncbi:MAG: sugar phosphate isomerase/epimerase [Methanophagales archaeon]|jgi:sugar phosphate isomerase/epimerase|nr:sugar phosphate isomerase/epimerase [Methanophagales archaeon]
MSMYVSTSCLSSKYNFSQILDVYTKSGIKNVELGICKDSTLDVTKLIKKYDLNYIVHHYFPPPKKPFIVNLASQDKQILRKSIDQIIKSIDFCADFDINFFSFHAGFRVDPDMNLKFDFNNIPEYENSFNTFKESVVKIVDYAERRSVKVAIENNVLSEYNLIDGQNKLLLMCELCEFERLFNEITSKNLGVLLDIGHLKVTSNLLKFDAEEFIHELKDKTFAVHVHENNGRIDEHKCISEGDWSLAIVNSYFKNKDIPIVLECKCSNEKELENGLMLLRGGDEDAIQTI